MCGTDEGFARCVIVMFEVIIEIILELFGEIILQFVFELLAEMVLQWVGKRFDGTEAPWLSAVIGYVSLGTAAGWISFYLLPSQLISSQTGQIVNLVVTPLVIGAAMSRVGAWRSLRGQLRLRIDRFVFAALFALAFALIRYWLAK